MNPERAVASCAPRSPGFEPGVSTTGAKWTAADAALACSRYVKDGSVYELDNVCAAAFRYRWARDEAVRSMIWAALMLEAVKMAEREGWPSRIKRMDLDTGKWSERPFLEDLVTLAITEEHDGWKLQKLDLWAAWMGVYPTVWRRVLSPRYEALREVLEIWCGTARRHIARRLRDE